MEAVLIKVELSNTFLSIQWLNYRGGLKNED